MASGRLSVTAFLSVASWLSAVGFRVAQDGVSSLQEVATQRRFLPRRSVAPLLLASAGLGGVAGDYSTGAFEDNVASFDTDGDGFITREEFLRGAAIVGAAAVRRDPSMTRQFAEAFVLVDSNGDGRLDRQEVAALANLGGSTFDGASEAVFQVLDGLHAMGLDHSELALAVELVEYVERGIQPFTDRGVFVPLILYIVGHDARFAPLAHLEPRVVGDWAERLFDAIDYDEDQLISPAEQTLLQRAVGMWWASVVDAESAAEEVAITLEEWDKNRDGRVEMGEFLAVAIEADPSGETSVRAERLFRSADVDRDGALDVQELERLFAIAQG